MKKSLFFVAAASALMLTACSRENDVVQDATKNTAAVQQQAVGFDIYTQQATNARRAGLEGTMTTGRMQRSENDGGGFGVYAFLTEDKNVAGGEANATSYQPANLAADPFVPNVPNFMVNEKILWNSQNLGWYYNPLKYWPNETDNDSQSTPASMQSDAQDGDPVADNDRHLDRLTFFAYAPYVSAGTTTGITGITDNTGKLGSANISDPTIAWKATTDVATFNPNEGVDLLWGVAPSGGLSYTAVNGWTVTRNEGTPLLNMIKPNVNTSMKFLFQHALARFGITVVAAIDQVSPGGKLDPNTKITIDNVKITGKFGTTGELNLNNDGNPSVANWTKIQNVAISNATTASNLTENSITVTANDATEDNNAIAKNLRWKGTHETPAKQEVVGVTPAKQDLLAPSNKWFAKLASTPAYNPAKVYYTDEAGTSPAVAKYTTTKKGEVYTYDDTEKKYVVVESGTAINAPVYPDYNKDSEYYTVAEVNTFSGNHVDTYSFKSWGDAEATTTPWGSGTVRIVSKTATTTTVEVVTNSVSGFEGKKFIVHAIPEDLTSVTTPLLLYNLDGTETSPKIYVNEIAAKTYGYTDADLPSDAKVYWRRNIGSTANPIWWYDYKGTKSAVSWGESNKYTYVTLSGSKINANDFKYAYAPGDYYEAERNYLYVVPTNNVWKKNSGLGDNPEDLRTITVQIEYYITTEDSKLAAGRAQTKNVITKEVVLPNLANGKSYNLNLVLGLTSVKVEAEVDDWKVENVQADLPQNTGE